MTKIGANEMYCFISYQVSIRKNYTELFIKPNANTEREALGKKACFSTRTTDFCTILVESTNGCLKTLLKGLKINTMMAAKSKDPSKILVINKVQKHFNSIC